MKTSPTGRKTKVMKRVSAARCSCVKACLFMSSSSAPSPGTRRKAHVRARNGLVAVEAQPGDVLDVREVGGSGRIAVRRLFADLEIASS